MQQKGSALLTVLAVLSVAAIMANWVFHWSSRGLADWKRSGDYWRALYAAESGIAHQLYLEKYHTDSVVDSTLSENDWRFEEESDLETMRFRFAPNLPLPAMTTGEDASFLDIRSEARIRDARVEVHARFGQKLDDSLFGAALILTDKGNGLRAAGAAELYGPVKLATPPRSPVEYRPLPGDFSLAALLGKSKEDKYSYREFQWREAIGSEEAQSGNGRFSPLDPPDFSRGDLVFSFGDVELANTRSEPWILKGPVRIFADGDIVVRGRIRLEDVELFAGRNVLFQDSIHGKGLQVFARESIWLRDRCRLELTAVAGQGIHLRESVQTTVHSILMVAGGRGKPPGEEDDKNARLSPNAIGAEEEFQGAVLRVHENAVARGFLLCAGEDSRIVLHDEETLVEGVVISEGEFWNWGTVNGAVLARISRCRLEDATDNCMMEGRIDRARMPRDLVQPRDLLPLPPEKVRFQLISWSRN